MDLERVKENAKTMSQMSMPDGKQARDNCNNWLPIGVGRIIRKKDYSIKQALIQNLSKRPYHQIILSQTEKMTVLILPTLDLVISKMIKTKAAM